MLVDKSGGFMCDMSTTLLDPAWKTARLAIGDGVSTSAQLRASSSSVPSPTDLIVVLASLILRPYFARPPRAWRQCCGMRGRRLKPLGA